MDGALLWTRGFSIGRSVAEKFADDEKFEFFFLQTDFRNISRCPIPILLVHTRGGAELYRTKKKIKALEQPGRQKSFENRKTENSF